MIHKLDIEKLNNAYESLFNALDYAKVKENNENDHFYTKEIIRAGVIKHFEYSYELSWKIMKKYIETENPDAKILTRKDLFRLAGQMGLIDNFDKWVDFHNARNKTSHTYNVKTSEEVYEIAKTFEKYMKKFINALKELMNYDEKIHDEKI
ncbi:MAG: nucleotidyltransferase substrate binding protein [Methanobrevibacter sp.]|nr:nucleotidyltransferase substrate binding protein [Candidatus Methanoflexus mossambicus]